MRRLVTLLAAYLLGYWKCSIAWLLLVLVVIVGLKDHSVQRKVRTQAARDKELLILRSSVNEGKLSMVSGTCPQCLFWLISHLTYSRFVPLYS